MLKKDVNCCVLFIDRKKTPLKSNSKELFTFFKFKQSEYGVNMIVIPEMSRRIRFFYFLMILCLNVIPSFITIFRK